MHLWWNFWSNLNRVWRTIFWCQKELWFLTSVFRSIFQNDSVALRRARFWLVLVNNEMQPAWGSPIIFWSVTTSGSIIRGQFTMQGLVISLDVPCFSTKEQPWRSSISLQQGRGAWWHVEVKIFSSQVLMENAKMAVIRCSCLLLKSKSLNLSYLCDYSFWIQ